MGLVLVFGLIVLFGAIVILRATGFFRAFPQLLLVGGLSIYAYVIVGEHHPHSMAVLAACAVPAVMVMPCLWRPALHQVDALDVGRRDGSGHLLEVAGVPPLRSSRSSSAASTLSVGCVCAGG